jgi:L-asparaginase II
MEVPILANVIRGTTVESVHRGHFIVMDGGGKTVTAVGDPATVTFFRSACKPFQAMPLLTSGAAEAFGFDESEVALACASHSGEPIHVSVAQGMLEKISLAEKDLHCGVHLPFNEAEANRMLRSGEQPTQLHNNCSGKHAAMLAVAKHVGADTGTYCDPRNPVQQMILETISLFTEIPKNKIQIGIDGCSAPNFALPLSAMAKSFANLIRPENFSDNIRAACTRIVNAMIKFPELIGGTERLDTMLMRAVPGKLISKVGADGVWLCAAAPSEKWPEGLAVALKIEDGDDKRSRPVVAVEILRKLEILSDTALPDVSPMPIKNRRGDSVGKVAAAGPFRI